MGMGLEVIEGFATAPGATFTALTMSAGNSLQVRNGPLGKKIYLLTMWAANQVTGVFRIRSPRLHDNVQGIRGTVVGVNTTAHAQTLTPDDLMQPLISQDVLIAELTGSAVAGDIESGAALLWYEDLPGINARLITDPQLATRGVNIFTVEVALTPGAGGGFTGARSINATFDLFKANTDYALVGYLVNAEAAAVRFTGIDTGNLGVGGPGSTAATVPERRLTEEWFQRISRLTALPTIPVFNSANKFGITVDAATNENATAVTVTAVMVELAPAA